MLRGSICAVLFVLLEDEVVGHAGDVVADYTRKGIFFGFFLVVVRESRRMLHPEGEKFLDYSFGILFFTG